MPWCAQNQPETLRRLSGGLCRCFVFINNKMLYTKLFYKRLPFQFHKIIFILIYNAGIIKKNLTMICFKMGVSSVR